MTKLPKSFIIFAGSMDDVQAARDYVKSNGLGSDDVELKKVTPDGEEPHIILRTKREIEWQASPNKKSNKK